MLFFFSLSLPETSSFSHTQHIKEITAAIMGLNPQMYVHVVVFLLFHYVYFLLKTDRQTGKKMSREQSARSSTVAQIVSC